MLNIPILIIKKGLKCLNKGKLNEQFTFLVIDKYFIGLDLNHAHWTE
jgi:hypothetical protein